MCARSAGASGRSATRRSRGPSNPTSDEPAAGLPGSESAPGHDCVPHDKGGRPTLAREIVDLLAPLADQWTRWPTPEEIAAALPFTTDPEDAPIFAAASVAQPDIVLSNDFRTFHSPLAKTFWEQNNLTVESLYGLRCVLGRWERK